MNCPHCSAELRMTERSGVEIDYCPSCRGVWLDRGELDKILARSSGDNPSGLLADRQDNDDTPPPPSAPPRKRESVWREVFDF